MDAEELIIRFHELTTKRIRLKKINSGLFCEIVRSNPESESCIGTLSDELIFSERHHVPEKVFSERLSTKGCPACIEIWRNKCEIKSYSRQIGAIKNRMHALAKKITK